ncbi:MAG TPA: flagellar motor switch protein FliN [Bryobacteraceae bacterium]|nr:flagellar motor switch protein FliN [Bryobacteraceae bacterium]
MTEERGSPARWFAEEWTTLLGTVLESLAGERPKLACSAPTGGSTLTTFSEEAVAQHGAVLWWQYRFPLPGEPCIWIGAPKNAWTQIAARVLGAAGVEDDSQARETYLEVLQQSLGELSRSAGRRWGRQVDCSGNEAAAAPESAEFYTVEATYPDAALPPLMVAVTGAPQDPPQEADPPAENAKTGGMAAGDAEAHNPQRSKTFNLLMGVELPVSVSFGHVQLPLKDVLKLTAGSIIELNRAVDELVEVIVNNCVVARGEVVVVEGNYGVRIHQIMTRQERLETLP